MLGGRRDAAVAEARRRSRRRPVAITSSGLGRRTLRSSAAIAAPGRARSRTGARSTLTPALEQRRRGGGALLAGVGGAARRPSPRPRRRAGRGGASTCPPSWSVMTSERRVERARGRRPPGAAPVIRRVGAAAGDVVLEQDHPGELAGGEHPQQPARRLGAVEAGDEPLAGELGRAQGGDRAGLGRRGGIAAAGVAAGEHPGGQADHRRDGRRRSRVPSGGVAGGGLRRGGGRAAIRGPGASPRG